VLTAQPSLDSHEIRRSQFKLAMAVGNSRKYRIFDIHGRHFVQSGKQAGLSQRLIEQAITDITDRCEAAFEHIEAQLPKGFPEAIHHSVKTAALARLRQLHPASDELTDEGDA
jgi:serine/threonine-protein kinase HipA